MRCLFSFHPHPLVPFQLATHILQFAYTLNKGIWDPILQFHSNCLSKLFSPYRPTPTQLTLFCFSIGKLLSHSFSTQSLSLSFLSLHNLYLCLSLYNLYLCLPSIRNLYLFFLDAIYISLSLYNFSFSIQFLSLSLFLCTSSIYRFTPPLSFSKRHPSSLSLSLTLSWESLKDPPTFIERVKRNEFFLINYSTPFQPQKQDLGRPRKNSDFGLPFKCPIWLQNT